MKQNFVYPLLYTILGGIIVALVNYWLTTPPEHKDNFSITHNVVQFDRESAVEMFVDWYAKSHTATSALSKDQLSSLRTNLALEFSGSTISVDTYHIENKDSNILKDLSIYVDDAIAVVIGDETGARLTTAKSLSKLPEVLPGKSIDVTILSDGYGYVTTYDNHVNATFVLAGRKLPITNVRIDASSTVYGWAQLLDNYGSGVAFFFLISALLWVLLIIAIVATLLVGKSIPSKAKNTSDEDLATAIRVLDYLEGNSPGRLAKIREIAHTQDAADKEKASTQAT